MKDENGSVSLASIKTYGDVIHTLINRDNYKGFFMPGYQKAAEDPINKLLPETVLLETDHVVGNMPDKGMLPVVEWYEKALGFHRFWTVDDKIIHTEYSSLRSTVMTDRDENIKMPINEPAKGLKKSQIQEYVEYYTGPGVQHVALRTDDILKSVAALRV